MALGDVRQVRILLVCKPPTCPTRPSRLIKQQVACKWLATLRRKGTLLTRAYAYLLDSYHPPPFLKPLKKNIWGNLLDRCRTRPFR